jgi:hypothetical protein
VNHHVTALFGLAGFQVLSAENVDGEWHLAVDAAGSGGLRGVRRDRRGEGPPGGDDGPRPAGRRRAGAAPVAQNKSSTADTRCARTRPGPNDITRSPHGRCSPTGPGNGRSSRSATTTGPSPPSPTISAWPCPHRLHPQPGSPEHDALRLLESWNADTATETQSEAR